MQAGFWLAFMAVGLLMASSPADTRPAPDAAPETPAGWRSLPARVARHVHGDVRTQVIATLGLTPLILVFFQQVSIVGFAANLIAIPLVTLVITPLALLGAIAVPLFGWVSGSCNCSSQR
ncbi:MAG TPA: ComEC/Rec2 family competence protein [Caldimonas sp.]